MTPSILYTEAEFKYPGFDQQQNVIVGIAIYVDDYEVNEHIPIRAYPSRGAEDDITKALAFHNLGWYIRGKEESRGDGFEEVNVFSDILKKEELLKIIEGWSKNMEKDSFERWFDDRAIINLQKLQSVATFSPLTACPQVAIVERLKKLKHEYSTVEYHTDYPTLFNGTRRLYEDVILPLN